LDLQAVLGRECRGHSLSHPEEAGVAHVAVAAGPRVLGQLAQYAVELGGRLRNGVAQREVIDVLRPEAGLEPLALLEHAAHP
jgi:hypothetical protein